MPTRSKSLDARLDAANRAIQGALYHPEILALVSARSFDREALEAGAALHDQPQLIEKLGITARA